MVEGCEICAHRSILLNLSSDLLVSRLVFVKFIVVMECCLTPGVVGDGFLLKLNRMV